MVLPSQTEYTKSQLETQPKHTHTHKHTHTPLCFVSLKTDYNPHRSKHNSLFLQHGVSDLEQPDDEDDQTDGLHDAGVVFQQGLMAALHPQVQLLCLVVVVEVG